MQAKNLAIGAGGDCVDKRQGQNFFREENDFVQSAFSKMGWETKSEFRDDNAGTTFTKEALFSSLGFKETHDSETGRINGVAPVEGNDFKAGDQVFLHINTHGGMAEMGPNGVMMEHSICIDGDYMPVSRLKRVLDALAAKGVKVALFDSSCYGGGSVKGLAGPNVCVMSGTTDNVTNAPGDLAKNMVARLAMSKLSKEDQDSLFGPFRSDRVKSKDELAAASKVSDLRAIYSPGFDEALKKTLMKDYTKKYKTPVPSEDEFHAMAKANELNREGLFDKAQLAKLANTDIHPFGAGDSTSVEDLFFATRADTSFGTDAMPAQISSDVDGMGLELSRKILPLGLTPTFMDPDNKDSKRIMEQTDAAFMGECPLPTLLDDFKQIFADVEKVKPENDEMKKVLAHLGYPDLKSVEKQMETYVANRKAAYDRLVKAADAFNDAVKAGYPASELSSLHKKLKSAQDAYTRMGQDKKLEKAYYAAQYIHQREQTKNDPKAKACSDFKF